MICRVWQPCFTQVKHCLLCSYDINLAPDKRKALIQQEQCLLELFQEVNSFMGPSIFRSQHNCFDCYLSSRSRLGSTEAAISLPVSLCVAGAL